MSLSLREKQNLYYSLGQLLKAGTPLPGALKSLAQTSSGSQRRLINDLNKAVNNGKTLGDAVASRRSEISELEIGIISACERSGRLEYGMSQLSVYYGEFAKAREAILKRCAYPIFVLHFAVLILPLKTLFVDGLVPYARQTGGSLILMYGLALIGYLLLPILRDAGASSAFFDALLRMVPKVGKLRVAFATSRFCATYNMQLEAGINVIDALDMAQRASMSGLMRAAIRKVIPEVRGGSQVGPLLAASGAFPEPMTRAVCIGEQTGQLDAELERMAAEYQAEGIGRLDTLAEWIPRLFYIGILCFVGYTIVRGYMGYLSMLDKITDGVF